MLKQKLKIIKPNKHRATAVTVAESEEDMRYKSFENLGVNVYEKGKLARRKTFKKLDEAIEFARDMGTACPYRNVPHLYCDKCEQEVDDLYEWDDKQVCIDCIVKSLDKVEIE